MGQQESLKNEAIVVTTEMNPYQDQISQSSSTSIGRRVIRQLRTLFKGSSKRRFGLLSVLCFLTFATYQSLSHLGDTLGNANLLTCSSLRQDHSSIAPPNAADTKILGEAYKSLEALFDAHPPQPSKLNRSEFPGAHEAIYPSTEEMNTWTNMTRPDAEISRQNHAYIVKELPALPPNLFSGRGVVMLAGGSFSEYAATSLGMLREVGSRLPAELWMKDASEETPGWCAELAREGITCRKLSDYMDVSGFKHPYQMKIFTILFSSFAKVLFLDGDNMPAQNPDPIFEAKGFLDTGVTLWPDFWHNTGTTYLPFIMGLSDEPSEILRNKTTVESGQLLWDKERHWKALCLATYYNYYGPDYYYTLITQGWSGWGDKDTFSMALEALHEPYYMVPHALLVAFVNGTIWGEGMLQASPLNETAFELMFMHLNMVKWSVRKLLCIGCASDPLTPVERSALENTDLPLAAHLRNGTRILASSNFETAKIDPEALIWKVLEHNICRTAWRDPGLCARTRAHMSKAFGYQFRAGRIATVLGYGENVCIQAP